MIKDIIQHHHSFILV